MSWLVAMGIGWALGACTPPPVQARRSSADGPGARADAGGIGPARADAALAADAAAERRAAGEAGVITPSSGDAATQADAARADVGGGALADAAAARAPRTGEIRIDELLVNPTGDDLGREWIEVVDVTADALDLSALHLANAAVDVAVPAGTIGPGALRVLGQSAAVAKNGGAPVDAAYGTRLILANADDAISICIGACATGVVIDQVVWGALGDGYVGHALEIDLATGTLCPAGDAFGTGGSFGTPGAPNPPCAASVGDDGGSAADGSVAD